MSGSPLKILIADDSPTNVKQLEILAQREGFRTLVALDGQTAVELFKSEAPDLVFMDVMMPGMDGITAVQHIRAQPSEKWTPIIFYSALDRVEDIVFGLDAGGDDYVAKPASSQLLRAKIKAYARLLAMQNKEQAYIEELESWRLDAEEQGRLGSHVMARLTDAEGLRDPMVHYFNLPADTFSGDLLCAQRAPSGVLNVMLADATGHGLSAALSALPITQTFYSMTAKGFPLSSIASELNRKLKALLPSDRFVAATLAALDVHNQTVEVWNGGNPDALFIDRAGRVTMQWASLHPPLGILADPVFSSLTETVVIHEPGELVLCSDGLVEAEDPAGHRLGLEGALDLLAGASEGTRRFRHLSQGVQAHLGGRRGHDDISCMMVSLPIERRKTFHFTPPVSRHQGSVAEWRLNLQYGAAELRYLDVVPAILGLMTQVVALKPHQGALFLIISELFNNALDHGLLGLDSMVKDIVGGFELYLQHRAERLARLEQGHISLSFLIHEDEGQAVLDIGVSDTGAGFDYGRWEREEEAGGDGDHPHGRGIALVRSLCAEVVFSGKGNRVWARYPL